jgi:hypothetical protein
MKAQMPMWLRAMQRAPYRTALMAAVAFSVPHYVDAREVAMQRSIATAAGATYWDSHDANGWWIGFGMMKMMRGARPFIALTVAVDTTNYNIRTQAIAAPAWIGGVAVDVVLTINTSIWVGLAFVGAANGAIDTGTGWTSGTNINIVINGSLAACGGTGGASNGGAGSAGGDALYLQWPVSIDNGAGFIAGGGGGGGGGSQLSDGTAFANGGGGGGGQGNPGGSGGPDSSGGSGPTAGTRTSRPRRPGWRRRLLPPSGGQRRIRRCVGAARRDGRQRPTVGHRVPERAAPPGAPSSATATRSPGSRAIT